MVADNAFLGKVSLWTAIIGIVLPMCLAVLAIVVFLFLTPHSRMGPSSDQWEGALASLAFCGILFVILELVALGCGIAARRTASGKAGLVISTGVAFLLLLLGLVAWMRLGWGA